MKKENLVVVLATCPQILTTICPADSISTCIVVSNIYLMSGVGNIFLSGFHDWLVVRRFDPNCTNGNTSASYLILGLSIF